MAWHQMRLALGGIQIYWKRYFPRNQVSSLKDCSPAEVIEDQDSIQNGIVVDYTNEMNAMTELIHNQNEIIETLRHDMENIGTRQHEELKKRIEHLEKSRKRVYK